MDRATRDKFAKRTPGPTSPNGCHCTPPEVYEPLNKDFKFTIDLTANTASAKLPRFYGPGSPIAEDALIANWSPADRGYSNPPYGTFIPLILDKAQREAERGALSVLLLPLRVAVWFKYYVVGYRFNRQGQRVSNPLGGCFEYRYVDRRITFLNEDGTPATISKEGNPCGAMFDSLIVVYKPRSQSAQRSLLYEPKVSIWNWEEAGR